MANIPRTVTSNDAVQRALKHWLVFENAGDFTATKTFFFLAPFAGFITAIGDIFMSLGNTGADGTDPLSLTLDVQVAGVSVLATLPSIDDTATDAVTTLVASTGAVVGVLSTTATVVDFAKGDLISVILTITRTTPEDEMADARVTLGLTESSDYDPDITLNKV